MVVPEIVPVRVPEIVPVRVPEMVPVLVAEMVPDFAKAAVPEIIRTNTVARIVDFVVFILCSCVSRTSGVIWSAEGCLQAILRADLTNNVCSLRHPCHQVLCQRIPRKVIGSKHRVYKINPVNFIAYASLIGLIIQ